jgi:hypothetical protein
MKEGPYGYTYIPRTGDCPGKLVINEAEAEIVRRPKKSGGDSRNRAKSERWKADCAKSFSTKLPCNALKWTSSKAGDPFPVMGCAPAVSFPTVGFRTITLTGTDSQGATGAATVLVSVVNPPANSPPIVTILTPHNNNFFYPDELVGIVGTANDPDNKSPLTYEWKLKDGTTWTTLGTGAMNDGQTITKSWKPADNVPFNCGGRTVRLYLYATDADGQTGSAYVDVYIGHPVC